MSDQLSRTLQILLRIKNLVQPDAAALKSRPESFQYLFVDVGSTVSDKNRDFAIMYVPIEGALNLALLNDASLWREAYDEGVMILGPQTMYMNLRVLEMMWTQVRQLKNQQAMMDAANAVIERVQDFGIRFQDVEASMNDTIKKMGKLKITTADSGQSIITAARNLLKAGARENKKKKSLSEMDDSMFLESETNETEP